MANFKCKCGNKINYGAIPCKQEYLVISDENFDSYEGNINSEELYSKMKSLLLCQKCKRLYFFDEGFNAPAKVYALEE